ncbi:MAG TPA: isoamylase early set domain-containing protein [Verrucomicrobiae bacterium]
MARELSEKTKVTFALHAPEAREVRLAGCFTQWEQAAKALRKQKDGTWKATIPLKPGTYEYRFMVDGQWRDDPNCTAYRPNTFGTHNCVRVVRGG